MPTVAQGKLVVLLPSLTDKIPEKTSPRSGDLFGSCFQDSRATTNGVRDEPYHPSQETVCSGGFLHFTLLIHLGSQSSKWCCLSSRMIWFPRPPVNLF